MHRDSVFISATIRKGHEMISGSGKFYIHPLCQSFS